MSFISSGAAITLAGTAVYSSISTTNVAGAGGAIVVGNKITTGALSAIGIGGAGGAITLGREVVVTGLIIASGSTGGAITFGDECTTGPVTSKPLVAPNSGGLVTVADDCATGGIDTTGTVAATFGGNIVIGDRCECGTIASTGASGGGSVTIGEGFTGTSIDCSSSTLGDGGAVLISHRLTLSAGITCTGAVNGGSITIGQNANLGGNIVGIGTIGNSGPVSLGDGAHYVGLTVGAAVNVGTIGIGKFCLFGAINANATAGTRGIFDILDGTTIAGTITATSSGASGIVTFGNSVTVTGNCLFGSISGAVGAVAIGMGCVLQDFRAGSSLASTGGITIGQATRVLLLLCNTGGGGGAVAGNIILGAGASAQDVYANSFNAGGSSGSVTLEPGASAAYIQVDSASGTGGNVTLKNSNIITGLNGFGIVMGSSSTGTILAVNARIQDFIDNVNGSSLFRDCIFSTPAANRDCIANLTASGSQYTNCLFVPNGTGFSIQATVPRTIIAYFMLQKNPLPPNVTLSEGSVTTSANLLAP